MTKKKKPKGKLHQIAGLSSQEHLLCESQVVFQEQDCSIWTSQPVEHHGAVLPPIDTKSAGTICSLLGFLGMTVQAAVSTNPQLATFLATSCRQETQTLNPSRYFTYSDCLSPVQGSFWETSKFGAVSTVLPKALKELLQQFRMMMSQTT